MAVCRLLIRHHAGGGEQSGLPWRLGVVYLKGGEAFGLLVEGASNSGRWLWLTDGDNYVTGQEKAEKKSPERARKWFNDSRNQRGRFGRR